ncbi:uncharacterized protein LOC121870015 [Homarus americanus]|uniref:Putative Zinc-finger double-stranded RNA-binding-containing protein n=1 Tax=Homarus americanus TaxID=6706 RepID=A0A8J5JWS3_HOMAM|nr:uncharacterized protein LOC121870015 [Homarus americanus]KAG7166022.1 putative Zinc-finger double-stranded RNA-binding-containing protein [Homarus americanus]
MSAAQYNTGTMSRLKYPIDQSSARDVMKKFSDMAYSLVHINIFQEAIRILYSEDFVMSIDLSKRLQFRCLICNREMNSEHALAEHCRSGGHQKNRDKKYRESGEVNIDALSANYSPHSIHFKLLNSQVNPLGLQMVEEYDRGHGTTYYKCILCGAHGKLDTMYHHLIGKKHTDKYIKSGCVLESSILTVNEREEIRRKLVKEEGVNVRALKTIKGQELFPKKWQAEAITSTALRMAKLSKRESRSSSRSPSPGPSRSKDSRSRSYHLSSQRSPQHSPKRSPPRSPKRRCTMPSLRQSPKPSLRSPVRSQSRDGSPLSNYRNKSPPPTVTSVPVVAKTNSGTVALLSIPLPPQLQPPAPPVVESRDKSVQKHDLEELMIQFNFIVKSHTMSESDIKTAEDAKLAIDLMFKIAESLHNVTLVYQGDAKLKTDEMHNKLKKQNELLRGILGYIKQRMESTWNKENCR